MSYATFVSTTLRATVHRRDIENKVVTVHENTNAGARGSRFPVVVRADGRVPELLAAVGRTLQGLRFPVMLSDSGRLYVGQQTAATVPVSAPTHQSPARARRDAYVRNTAEVVAETERLRREYPLTEAMTLVLTDRRRAARICDGAITGFTALRADILDRLEKALPNMTADQAIAVGPRRFMPKDPTVDPTPHILLTYEKAARDQIERATKLRARAVPVRSAAAGPSVPELVEGARAKGKITDARRDQLLGKKPSRPVTEPAPSSRPLTTCPPDDPARSMSRDEVIAAIRADLKRRSDKAWSVRGGTGTAYGWISISAPPRRMEDGMMTVEDAAELHALLGIDYRPAPGVRIARVTVPVSAEYRREFLDRAAGRTPTVVGKPYWD